MACGLPVIASNSSSLPEAVGEAGVLVSSSDIAAWTNAMADLLDSSEDRSRYRELGKDQAKSFTWQSTARQVVSSYRKALEHG